MENVFFIVFLQKNPLRGASNGESSKSVKPDTTGSKNDYFPAGGEKNRKIVGPESGFLRKYKSTTNISQP